MDRIIPTPEELREAANAALQDTTFEDRQQWLRSDCGRALGYLLAAHKMESLERAEGGDYDGTHQMAARLAESRAMSELWGDVVETFLYQGDREETSE